MGGRRGEAFGIPRAAIAARGLSFILGNHNAISRCREGPDERSLRRLGAKDYREFRRCTCVHCRGSAPRTIAMRSFRVYLRDP